MNDSERHPIQEPPAPKTLEEAGEQIRLLHIRLAQLWDEVWWHQLPWWRRAFYRVHGFKSPITRFYGPDA